MDRLANEVEIGVLFTELELAPYEAKSSDGLATSSCLSPVCEMGPGPARAALPPISTSSR